MSTITLTGQVDPNALGDNGGAFVPTVLPLLLPLAVIAVPLVDLLLAVIRRTRAGRSPFAPDKLHIHHRLLDFHRRRGGQAWFGKQYHGEGQTSGPASTA